MQNETPVVSPSDPTEAASPSNGPPPGVPEKFWDPEAGAIRVEALLRSYLELERKLGRSLPLPQGPEDREARDRLLAALGRPEKPEEYEIRAVEGLIEPDPEINRRLHAAGFTQEQVQLVYDLALERLVPLVRELASEAAFLRERERLEAHFGGPERWREVARELKTWGEAHLEPEVFAALASSYRGVLALHRMMAGTEPRISGGGEGRETRLDEKALDQMIRDPRYWRDRDPEFVARVTEGFKALYGD
ncbi:MAG: hypothetical protein N2038_10390 [Geminicoccaceae bacterium]|nr:hypothetical protein [Geminicoccaceae bacterium]MCX7630647.1 hypothetical protein [Geminicoccaceae bacterium]